MLYDEAVPPVPVFWLEYVGRSVRVKGLIEVDESVTVELSLLDVVLGVDDAGYP